MSEFFNHVVFQNFVNDQIDNTLVLKDGSTFSERALEIVGVDSFIKFYRKMYHDTCLSYENVPHLVCSGCASLNQLEQIIYDQYLKDYVNLHGLNIYLFEDLYVSYGIKIKNHLEGPPLQGDTSHYYSRYGNSIRGFESTPQNLKTVYAFELESIKIFVENNKLDKVTVYCGDYNASRYLQSVYPMFKINTRNLYVISAATRILSDQSFSPIINPKAITHKFISANGKYKAVRHLVAAHLLDRSSILSFDQRKSIWGSLQNQLWFDLSIWNKTNTKMFIKLMSSIKKLEATPPLVIGNGNIPNPNFEIGFDFAPVSEYERCFCAVVIETKYSHPVATFSEKTLNAIARCRPFILVAPPYTLEYLKHYGFKTFDSYWDESYDHEENHEQRLIKIFKTIDYIDNLSITSLRNLYQKLTPILEHNYNVIKTIPKAWPL